MKTTPSPPDTIMVPAGSYLLSQGPLTVDQSVNVAGAGAQTTQIEQETTSQTSRVFDIQRKANSGVTPTVVISGLAMAFGKADSTNGYFGGDVRNQGILTLSEDLIEDGSTTSGSGGGISNDGGTLTLTHSLVWNNSSTNPNGGGDSGGIQNYGDDTSAPGPSRSTTRRSPTTPRLSAAGSSAGAPAAAASAPRPAPPTPRRSRTRRSRTTTAARARPTAAGCWRVRALLGGELDRRLEHRDQPAHGGQMRPTAACRAQARSARSATTSRPHPTAASRPPAISRTLSPGFLTGGLAFNGGNTETFAFERHEPRRRRRSRRPRRAARAPTSATSPGPRAPAATSAPTSCSSRSRGQQFTRSSARSAQPR